MATTDTHDGDEERFNLGAVIPQLLGSQPKDPSQADTDTFYASSIGDCPRQLYLSKTGVTKRPRLHGRPPVRRLIQDYAEQGIEFRYPRLETGPTAVVEEEGVRIVGRPTAYDPQTETIYQLKTRNEWYKFHPPVEPHLDQVQAYMNALGAERAQLIYLSVADLTDIRVWPPLSSDEDGFIQFDEERYQELVTKAQTVTAALQEISDPEHVDDVPFDECGCWRCENEKTTLKGDEEDNEASGKTSPQSISADARQDRTVITADPLDVEDTWSAVGEGAGYHVPTPLRELQYWVVWAPPEKIALAPWETKTMYPCQWAEDGDVDPRERYEKAKMVAELDPEQIHHAWPFPDQHDLPDRVWPAILLPHDTADPPLAIIDLDGVRDPDSGEITGEAWRITEEVGGYVEISPSGEGLHLFCRGELPETVGRFSAPLHGEGGVEIYDRSRFLASTWNHLAETPPNSIPEAQDAMDRVIATYTSEATHPSLEVESPGES